MAREVGIKQQTLHRWKMQIESGSGEGASSGDNNRELERLRRENVRLKAADAMDVRAVWRDQGAWDISAAAIVRRA